MACVARTESELAEAAADVRAAGRRAVEIQADIGDPDAAGLIAARAQAALGDVDIVVNNAATVTPVGPTAAVDPDQWARGFAVNVVGPMRLTRAVLDGMIKRGWGRIVNVSSGVVASPDAMIRANAYATTKAALEAHTLNLAAELRGTGVTVNVYRPGRVDTAMQAWIRDQDPGRIGTELHEQFTRWGAEGILITPEHSAAVLIAHLNGDDTGAIWDVNAAPVPS